jgi:hypothetical protein
MYLWIKATNILHPNILNPYVLLKNDHPLPPYAILVGSWVHRPWVVNNVVIPCPILGGRIGNPLSKIEKFEVQFCCNSPRGNSLEMYLLRYDLLFPKLSQIGLKAKVSFLV